MPLREQGMEPFEVMVSESQERMLCVVEPERVHAVMELCAKWEVGGRRSAGHAPRACGCSPAASWSGTCRCSALVDECPLYDLQPVRPRSRVPRAASARWRVM